MRVLALIAGVLAGCALILFDDPPYPVPVIASNGSVRVVTFEPTGAGRFLFCIETPGAVMCIAESDGRAVRYSVPAKQRPGAQT